MAGSGNEQMDQETAQFLFREGGTLIFLDVPPGTEFGIDYNSWFVGPKFKGVKMIPPGIHFVYYSAVNRGQAAPRTGFFHNFTKRQVLLKRWDPSTEAVRIEVVSTEDQESAEKNKRDMDRFLGPYPYDSYRMWVSLTNHVTPGLLSRLNPLCGQVSSVTALMSPGSNTSERQQQRQQQREGETPGTDGLPEMPVVPGTELRFTPIPARKYPAGTTPAEITRHNMDHSYVLTTLIDTVYHNIQEPAEAGIVKSREPAGTGTVTSMELAESSEHMTQEPAETSTVTLREPVETSMVTNPVPPKTRPQTPAKSETLLIPASKPELLVLGELQFAFICFLLGQNYDGFEQWKLLVHLLCSCEEAVSNYPDLYSQVITVLHRQLSEVPEDFFIDIVTANNFLTRTLQAFFATLEELEDGAGSLGVLRKKGLRFRRHLQKKYDWDFTTNPDDYAPVVVSMETGEYAPMVVA